MLKINYIFSSKALAAVACLTISSLCLNVSASDRRRVDMLDQVVQSDESKKANEVKQNNDNKVKFDRAMRYLREGNENKGTSILEEIYETYAPAANELGNFYRDKGDCKRALEFYKVAAKNGNSDAMCSIGVIYLTGEGDVQISAKDGIDWLKEAAKNNNEVAITNLGFIYEYGMEEAGIKPDVKEAFSYYAQGAKLGIADCAYSLGTFYENGKGCVKDPAKAYKWYNEADKKGSLDGKAAIGRCLLEGIGIPQNDDIAKDPIEKAAAAGNAEGQFLTGRLYEEGRCGKTKDLNQAKEWYKKAADQGHENASKRLDAINKALQLTPGNIGTISTIGSGHKPNKRLPSQINQIISKDYTVI